MSWSDNFPVYLDNLSTVYTASVLIAVFALFVAHYYQSHDQHKEDKTTKRKRKNSDSTDESSEERVRIDLAIDSLNNLCFFLYS
jgi:hypothetical protein